MTTGSDEDAHMLRADLVTGVVLLLLGIVIAYLSYVMPRLENRGVIAVTAPGLVPGILGVVLALLGGLLVVRSVPALRDPAGWRMFLRMFVGPQARRAIVVIALALFYPLFLVGNIPFGVATALFVFVFVMVFECLLTDGTPRWGRSALFATILAVTVAAAVVGVFEHGFLVRLP